MNITIPLPNKDMLTTLRDILSNTVGTMKCSNISIPFHRRDWYDPFDRIVMTDNQNSISIRCTFKGKYYELIVNESILCLKSDQSAQDDLNTIQAMCRAIQYNGTKAKPISLNIYTRDIIAA